MLVTHVKMVDNVTMERINSSASVGMVGQDPHVHKVSLKIESVIW